MIVPPKVLRTGGLALACAVLACGGVYLLGGGDETATTARIELVAAKRGNVTSAISASGNTVDANSRDLSFSASGTVRKVYVRPGQKVRAGQALARVDGTEARENYLAARAALSAAYEALDDAEEAESSSTASPTSDRSSTSTSDRTTSRQSAAPSAGPSSSPAATCPPGGGGASATPAASSAAPSPSVVGPVVVTPAAPAVTTSSTPVPISTTTSRPTPISTTTSEPTPISTVTTTTTSEPGSAGQETVRQSSEVKQSSRRAHAQPTPEPSDSASTPEPAQPTQENRPNPAPTVTVTQTIIIKERVTVRETVTVTQGIIETIVKMLTVTTNTGSGGVGGSSGFSPAATTGGGADPSASPSGKASARPSTTSGPAATCGTGTGTGTGTGKSTTGNRATGSNGSTGGASPQGGSSGTGASGGAAGGSSGAGSGGGSGMGGGTTSVEQAEADLATAKREFADAKEALAGVIIKAPSKGTVMTVGGKAGDTASAGSAFITLGNLDELQVNALFTESDVGKLKVGQQATVTMDTHPGQEFTGTITHIDVTATTSDQLVRYGVRVALSSSPENLLVGQTAYVQVTTDEAENAVYVPARAVEIGSGGTATVTVRSGDQDVRRQVKTGVESDQYIQIVEGLDEGDQVIVSSGASGPGTFPDGTFPGLTPTPTPTGARQVRPGGDATPGR